MLKKPVCLIPERKIEKLSLNVHMKSKQRDVTVPLVFKPFNNLILAAGVWEPCLLRHIEQQSQSLFANESINIVGRFDINNCRHCRELLQTPNVV